MYVRPKLKLVSLGGLDLLSRLLSTVMLLHLGSLCLELILLGLHGLVLSLLLLQEKVLVTLLLRHLLDLRWLTCLLNSFPALLEKLEVISIEFVALAVG